MNSDVHEISSDADSSETYSSDIGPPPSGQQLPKMASPQSQSPPFSTQPPNALKTEATEEHGEDNEDKPHPNDQLRDQGDVSNTNKDANDSDPGERIEDFDWDGLIQEYEVALQECDDKERKIYEEIKELTDFFYTWAGTVQNHEVDRSYKRILTRQFHVSNSEDQLETKRQHYIKVVEAFRSALQLLNGP